MIHVRRSGSNGIERDAVIVFGSTLAEKAPDSNNLSEASLPRDAEELAGTRPLDNPIDPRSDLEPTTGLSMMAVVAASAAVAAASAAMAAAMATMSAPVPATVSAAMPTMPAGDAGELLFGKLAFRGLFGQYQMLRVRRVFDDFDRRSRVHVDSTFLQHRRGVGEEPLLQCRIIPAISDEQIPFQLPSTVRAGHLETSFITEPVARDAHNAHPSSNDIRRIGLRLPSRPKENTLPQPDAARAAQDFMNAAVSTIFQLRVAESSRHQTSVAFQPANATCLSHKCARITRQPDSETTAILISARTRIGQPANDAGETGGVNWLRSDKSSKRTRLKIVSSRRIEACTCTKRHLQHQSFCCTDIFESIRGGTGDEITVSMNVH